MNNSILKYVMRKEKKSNVFHTSSFGVAQSGDGIGASSSQSFSDRMKIDRSRQTVRGYEDAEIVRGTRNTELRAKPYEPPKDTGLRRQGGGIRAGSAGTIQKQN